MRYIDYVRRVVEERYLVGEAVDPDVIEGFATFEETCAGEPLFEEISGYSFNEVDQVQGRTITGSKPKLHQSAFAYYV